MTREKRDAFIRYRKDKRFEGIPDNGELIAYIASESCINDLKKLINRDYFIPPPYHYQVPKNFSGKKRDVYTWKGETGYLFKLIGFCLRDWDHMYSDGLYSFRFSRVAKDFLLKLKEFEHIEDYYIIKLDVSNYVGSIVPELIIPRLGEMCGDDLSFFELLRFILFRRECTERSGEVVHCEPGGLGGIPLGNMFMNVYLMELDEFIYPKAPLYCRYSDDIFILAGNKEEAQLYIDYLLNILKEKKLTTNDEKTCLIEPGGAADMLGFRLEGGKMDIAPHSKNKLKRKIRVYANRMLQLKRKQCLSDEECGKRLLQYYSNLFFGGEKSTGLTWAKWLFPIISDTASLKELDHYIQDAVRYCMCGSMSEKRYRVTYKDLKDLGYQSLVHSYYHFKTPRS